MKKLILAILLLPFLAHADLTSTDKQNLQYHNFMQNGGFESSKYGWTATGGVLTIDSTNFSAGKASGLLTLSSVQANLFNQPTPNSQYVNTTMEASCKIKTTVAGTQLCNLVNGSNGTCTNANTSGVWSTVSAIFTGPANGSQLGMRIQTSGVTTGTINIDECYIGAARLSTLNRVAFTTAGSFSWVVPSGVTSVTVFGRGGSGGGGSGTAQTTPTNNNGGGGGGGTVSYPITTSVTPGTTITVVVGAGGAGGAAQVSNNSNGNPGASGSSSSFNGLLFKNIGLGGAGGVVASGTGAAGGSVQFNPVSGAGGTGGRNAAAAAGGASISGTGGTGGTVTGAASGGGGGGAGDGNGANGSNGVQSSPGVDGGDGSNGGGGGGSGATEAEPSGRGGNGSDGAIVITY